MSDQELKELCDRLIAEVERRLPDGQECSILIGTEDDDFLEWITSGDRLLEVLNEQ